MKIASLGLRLFWTLSLIMLYVVSPIWFVWAFFYIWGSNQPIFIKLLGSCMPTILAFAVMIFGGLLIDEIQKVCKLFKLELEDYTEDK